MRRVSLGLWAFVAVAFVDCRKGPPDEVVYTGRSAKDSKSPVPVPTTLPPVVEPPAPTGEFSKARLLAAIADCAFERFNDFDGKAKALATATRAFEASATDEAKASMQAAWRSAMDSWQEAELFRVGPGAHTSEPGGLDLRDPIYSFPAVNRCRVEEELVAKGYSSAGFGTSLVNGRGLAAFEYLAFYGGADNACSRFSPINAGTTPNTTWAGLDAFELAQRKANYAVAIAEDVAAHSSRLLAAWNPNGASFHGAFTTAGRGSAVFATEQDAFNALTIALFYVEKDVKDLKLGRPLGYLECFSGPTCPEFVESRFAAASVDHIRANYRGFRRIFQGCGADGAGLGIDDWLRAVGASDLATRMIAALHGAELALDPIDVPLDQAIQTKFDAVANAHAALRALTDPLKTEFVSVLNLELPKSSEGDND